MNMESRWTKLISINEKYFKFFYDKELYDTAGNSFTITTENRIKLKNGVEGNPYFESYPEIDKKFKENGLFIKELFYSKGWTGTEYLHIIYSIVVSRDKRSGSIMIPDGTKLKQKFQAYLREKTIDEVLNS